MTILSELICNIYLFVYLFIYLFIYLSEHILTKMTLRKFQKNGAYIHNMS